MNQLLEDLLYESGLTAQGSWDKFDEYDRAAIAVFAELLIRDCVDRAHEGGLGTECSKRIILDYYGYSEEL